MYLLIDDWYSYINKYVDNWWHTVYISTTIFFYIMCFFAISRVNTNQINCILNCEI